MANTDVASRRIGADWHPNAVEASWIARVSYGQVALLVVMVFTAVSMARGYGER